MDIVIDQFMAKLDFYRYISHPLEITRLQGKKVKFEPFVV